MIKGLYYITTDYYAELYEKYFLPTAKKTNLELIEHKAPVDGGYFDVKFKKIINFKLEKIIESISELDNSFVIWSDVDLFFYKPSLLVPDLQSRIGIADILISPEWMPKARHRNRFNRRIKGDFCNTGFMVIKKNEVCMAFFKEVLRACKERNWTEQPVINEFIKNGFPIIFHSLPDIYWNITLGFPISPHTIMAHANWIRDYSGKDVIERKINAFKHIKKFLPKVYV